MMDALWHVVDTSGVALSDMLIFYPVGAQYAALKNIWLKKQGMRLFYRVWWH